MIKYSLTVLSIASFFFLRWLFPADVTITPNAPAKINPGEDFTYEITVSKAGVTGFAKIQQELPQGCSAEQVDVKGASFSCVGGVVKLIWMSLPAEDEFTISYKVKTDASLSGTQNIVGKFSFLENNEKKTVDIPMTSIEFAGSSMAAATTSEEKPAEVTPVTETTTTETSPAVATTTEIVNTSVPTETAAANESTTKMASSDNNTVTGERMISKTGEGKYKIDVTIKNAGLSGFAKMQDILPAGMLGYEDASNSAVFSFVSSKVKFVWMSVPDQREIRVSYIVTANAESDLKNITGEFSYLDNNETKRVSIATVSMPGESAPSKPAVAETKTTTPTTPKPVEEVKEAITENTSTPEKAVEQKESPKVAEETKSVETPKAVASTTKTVTSSVPPVSNGVAYKVQVCASKKDVGSTQDYFSKNYNFSEEQVYMETHEGWMKYTIGAYTNYKGARDRRNEVTSKYKFPGPFVTAYNNGKRITVQEALMVSRDKWVP